VPSRESDDGPYLWYWCHLTSLSTDTGRESPIGSAHFIPTDRQMVHIPQRMSDDKDTPSVHVLST